MSPATQPLDPRSLPIKEEKIEKDIATTTDTRLSHDDQQGCMYVYRKDSSPVESTRPDHDYIDIERKQRELSENIFIQRARCSYLALTMFPGDVMSHPAFCGGRMETWLNAISMLIVPRKAHPRFHK